MLLKPVVCLELACDWNACFRARFPFFVRAPFLPQGSTETSAVGFSGFLADAASLTAAADAADAAGAPAAGSSPAARVDDATAHAGGVGGSRGILPFARPAAADGNGELAAPSVQEGPSGERGTSVAMVVPMQSVSAAPTAASATATGARKKEVQVVPAPASSSGVS